MKIMSDKPAPQEMLQHIRSFIGVTKTHIGSGGEIDLSGLEVKVQELCEAVLDMPKHEADAYRQSLAELVAELDGLKAQMMAAQAELRNQLNTLNMQQKAVKAYKTNEAIVPPKKSEE